MARPFEEGPLSVTITVIEGVTMQEERNARIVVRYDVSICTHSGNCVRGLPAVFDVGKDPWINVNGAEPSAIAKAITACPSGALSYELVSQPSKS